MTLISDFEGGTTDVNSPYWDGWFQASVVSTTNLEGSYAGEVDSSSSDVIAYTQRSPTTYTPQEIKFLYRPLTGTSQGGGGIISLRDLDTLDRIITVNFGTDIELVGPNIDTGSYSTDTTYRFTLTNIDYNSQTFDIQIYNVTNSSEHYSGADISFREPASTFSEVRIEVGGGAIAQFDNFSATETLNGSPPSNLSVSSTATSADLSWVDNTTNEDGFYIYRDTTSPVSLTSTNRISTISPNSTTYTDSGVEDATTYYYVVSAFTPDDEDATNEATTTTSLPAPTDFSVDSVSKTSASTSWNLQSTNEDEVRTYYQLGSDPFQQDSTLNPGSESYTFSGLLNGRTYSFYASAWTSEEESDSNIDTATTKVADINNLSLDSSTIGEIDVTWSSNQNNGQYHLQLKEVESGNVVDTADVNYDVYSHTFTSITDGVNYEVGVRVETQDVTGNYVTASVVSGLPPIQISNIEYKRGGYVEIQMDRQDNLSSGTIEIYRSQTDGDLGDRITVLSDPTTSVYRDTQIEPMKDYYYTVRRIS